MDQEHISYNPDQPEIITNRQTTSERGLVGFLIKRGLARDPQSANRLLIGVSIVCLILALIISLI